MYPVPPESELRFLEGATVIQVCIGRNEAILRMHKDVTITIECAITFVERDGHESTYESSADAATMLVNLLDRQVTRVQRLDSAGIELVFQNSERLRLRDSSPGYESFQIQHGQQLIVV
jgi:hypothetical protein